MKNKKTVEAYLEKHSEWSATLIILRRLLLETELKETVKWGLPVYTLDGKNVAGIGAFKSYAGIWFFQGAFLQDEKGLLINAQEGKTKAMRQWRFQSATEIDEDLVREYLTEAIENQKQGKEIKPARNKRLVIPPELKAVLAEKPEVKKQFDTLTPGARRAFADYIAEAKRAETKQNRLAKIVPMILEGVGLNDRYN